MNQTDITIPAVDGYCLAATQYTPDEMNETIILINSATAVPRGFYQQFATFFADQGFTVLTYDYRGIGGSRPESLRGFSARARDWALDMEGMIDWIDSTLSPQNIAIAGHSFGGQLMGLLPNAHKVDAMVTIAAQSGYWALQGGNEKYMVAFHVHLTFPLLTHLAGYMPWSSFSSAEDLPKGVALEWASWCRNPKYLLGDETLPLERFSDFTAPVLAYSMDDDDWGTPRAVDAMMSAYPNVKRCHIVPAEYGLTKIGHMGFFRSFSQSIWKEVLEWLENKLRNKN